MGGFKAYPGMVEHLETANFTRKALERRAERIASAARIFTPVRTGRLKRGWKVKSGRKGKRAYARVYNNVRYAVFVEKGTRYMKGRRMLARAVALVDKL